MSTALSFLDPRRHGFLRAAVAVPRVCVADPLFNASRTLELATQASRAGAELLLFPELGLSAYTCEDLFHQQTLLEGVLKGLESLVQASRELQPVLVVGAPLLIREQLFNGAVLLHRGSILGIVPKTYLPNYREFYEKRHFASGQGVAIQDVNLLGQRVPFGTDLLFEALDRPHLVLHTEICEDLWAPLPPSTLGALAGATVLLNLSASNATIGKAGYRRELCAGQSGRCVAAYLYSAAGAGESTTDLAWDGYALIYENHELLAESQRFSDEPQLLLADVDLERLAQDRMRLSSFSDSVQIHRSLHGHFRRIPFKLGSGNLPLELSSSPVGATPLLRSVPRFPYVPDDPGQLDERCYEAYSIQVHGLMQRLRASKLNKLVLGVSGGLDSTHALIVAVRCMDRLKLPRTHILAYSLPGFATSERTRTNAAALMEALGVTWEEMDIRPSCLQMLKDLRHPFAEGAPLHDITFENVQAGERTSHLFRLANFHQALVLGTGDLSELALGWCTYGVGDHMSHYNVNASVPKTLIQHLLRWVAQREEFGTEASSILRSILETEISPELIPGEGVDGAPTQKTEDTIGPYELQDFNTYFITRYGFRPSKVAFLALHAWGDKHKGAWAPGLSPEKRNQYDLASIKRYLKIFLWRFFQTSQFKRSCVPNGPKVGSGGSLSPRGDWRAPSDGEARAWMEELKEQVP